MVYKKVVISKINPQSSWICGFIAMDLIMGSLNIPEKGERFSIAPTLLKIRRFVREISRALPSEHVIYIILIGTLKLA